MPSTEPSGLMSSSTTAIAGATMALPMEGNSREALPPLFALAFSPPFRSSMVTTWPRCCTSVASNTAMPKPNNAGMKLETITAEGWMSKPEAAAMVLGFGEMMLPALPPPESATSSANLDTCIFEPTSMAMGATISTATGMNTPTAQMTIVASANAKIASFSPKVTTMVWAMRLAAPDSIITPANTPAASTRTTVPITLCVPETTMSTVCDSVAPPMTHPTTAPSISA